MGYDVAFMGSKQARPSLPNPACGGCSGLVQVDQKAETYYLTRDYYTMGQFSKFIKAGAVFLASNQDSKIDYGAEVIALAFKNPDETLVVVARNSNPTKEVPLRVTLKNGGIWSGNLPRASVTTWILPKHGLGFANRSSEFSLNRSFGLASSTEVVVKSI